MKSLIVGKGATLSLDLLVRSLDGPLRRRGRMGLLVVSYALCMRPALFTDIRRAWSGSSL